MNGLMPLQASAQKSQEQRIVEQLDQLPLYQSYERAFGEATGLAVRLVPFGGWRTKHARRCCAHVFCQLFARQNKTRENCRITNIF